MLPVLESFSKTHNVSIPTVIADAAMLSEKVLSELRSRNISYIVGARIANLSLGLIKDISEKLNKQNNLKSDIENKSNSSLFRP
jgi:hypothetical protein